MNIQEAKKIENKIVKLLKETIQTDSVVLGVSGGADSIFLFHMLNTAGIDINIAHINHQLRGNDSELDEKFVKNLSNKVFVKSVNINKLSKENKTGIEETGRKIRYDYFKKLAKETQSNFIITAHHADDNIETVILNLSRGSALKGLSGMEELENLSDNLFLFRPLLFISKTEILDYLKLKNLKFREDASNKDAIYKRNHIRLKIIPELKKINPNLAKTIARNSQNIKEVDKELELNAEKWLDKNQTANNLDATKFRNESRSIQKYILLNYYQNNFGHTKNIESVHLDECLELINKNVGNKTKKLGKLNLSIKNNIITLKK